MPQSGNAPIGQVPNLGDLGHDFVLPQVALSERIKEILGEDLEHPKNGAAPLAFASPRVRLLTFLHHLLDLFISGRRRHCQRERVNASPLRVPLPSAKCGLLFLLRLLRFHSCVATSIPLFVSFEVRAIDSLCWLGFLATAWLWALITFLRIETVVYLPAELVFAMKPRTRANEHVIAKPFWTVVPRRRTVIRSHIEITVRTFRRYSHHHAHLGRRFRCHCRETTHRNRSYRQEFQSSHKFSS